MALDPLTAGIDFGSRLIERLWPNKADAEAAKLKLVELQQNGELARIAQEVELAKGQMGVNAAEAGNASLFVSGWRPWVGWVCGMAFAWQFVLGPIAVFAAHANGVTVDLPRIDSAELTTVLLGMLGLGGLRTFERVRGVIPPGK